MKPEPCSCDICGMIFVNEKELAKHRALVHATDNDQKMFQCQSCSKFFDSKEDFTKHAIETHNEKFDYNIGKTVTEDIIEKGITIANIKDKEQGNNNTESRLLKRVNSEEKARKRTRGPYRKSSP
jgi:uncharacterized C2H2 Zn-finger protein